MIKNVMVAGGASALVRGNLARKLGHHNIKIGWHVSDMDGGPYNGLPAGCDAVVILRDMLSHALFDKVMADTRPVGLPTAAIPRKWSHAEAILRMQGILAPRAKNEKTDPQPADIIALAVQYIVNERQDGRNPKRTEVEAAVQRAYGHQTGLDAAMFEEAHSRACQTIRASPADDPKAISREVDSWVTILIEDAPERILDAAGLARSVAGHISVPSVDSIVMDVNASVQRVRKQWAQRSGSNYEWRQGLMRKWLATWFQRGMETGVDWPGYDVIQQRTKLIFGVLPNWGFVREIRAEALGEWARDLFSTPAMAIKYAADTYPKLHLDVRALVHAKAIPAARTPTAASKDWFVTSALAIDDYVTKLQTKPPVPVAPVQETPVQETPVPEAPLVQTPQPDMTEVALVLAGMIEERLVTHMQGINDRLTNIERTLESLVSRSQNPDPSQELVASVKEIRVILNTSQPTR